MMTKGIFRVALTMSRFTNKLIRYYEFEKKPNDELFSRVLSDNRTEALEKYNRNVVT